MGEKPGEADETEGRFTPAGSVDAAREAGSGMATGRAVAGGGTDPTPAEASNLNLSKSNINRTAGGGGDVSVDAQTPDTARSSDPLKGLNVEKSKPPN
jgi:hypothetical protein